MPVDEYLELPELCDVFLYAMDAELDQALYAPATKATSLYQQVGRQVIDSNAIFFLGDVKDVFVLNKNLTGVQSVPEYPWTIDYATVKRTGA